MFSSSYKALHPWTDSTGFRTHGFRYRTSSADPIARLAEDFLLNSRYERRDPEGEFSIEAYFTDSGVTMLEAVGEEEPAGLEVVALPRGAPMRRELGETLRHRQSLRQYTGDPIELPYLASLLRSAAAVTHMAEPELSGGGHARLRFRAASSGGGLYPIDVLAVTPRVRGLEPGIYRYRALDDALLREGDEDAMKRLLDCFALPDEVVSVSRAAAVLLFVARPWRSMRKYGPRGLRFVFIEAGEMAGNVHLAATALGVGSVDCASFIDDEAHEALEIDGVHRTLVHSIVLGQTG